jgi:hypothetical protein
MLDEVDIQGGLGRTPRCRLGIVAAAGGVSTRFACGQGGGGGAIEPGVFRRQGRGVARRRGDQGLPAVERQGRHGRGHGEKPAPSRDGSGPVCLAPCRRAGVGRLDGGEPRADSLGEARPEHWPELVAQHLLHEVIAFPGRAQCAILGERTEQAAHFVLARLAVEKSGQQLFHLVTSHHCFSRSGLSALSIASRARKIRERTVPIGQSMTSAISS